MYQIITLAITACHSGQRGNVLPHGHNGIGT